MKALFCTDGSKISFNAIYNFARWSNRELTDAICVIDWNFLPEDVDVEQSDFNLSCSNLADNILKFTENELQKTGLKLGKTIKMCGGVTDLILDELQTGEYDIVLLGSHGKKGLQKWLGSVSFDILSSSPVSVYVSKHKNKAHKVLLAISDKTNSAEHFRSELEKLKLEDKEIHICIVNESPNLLFLEGTLDTNWYLKIEEEQKKYAYSIVKNLENILESMGLYSAKSVIITGIPAQEVINYANDNSIDLVILDGKHEEKKSKLFSNQTGKRICDNVSCDVLVIK